MPPRRSPLLAWVVWIAVLAAATAALLAGRSRLGEAHVALVLLLVVLFGAAAAGRAVGLGLAILSFLLFNWFFLRPYGTLVIHDPLDWLVLVAYLVTSVVAAQLLARARRSAADAEHAAALREADRLKDALLASVSHDLRTPLTSIKAHAQGLRELGDERAEIIEHEADRLGRLVEDLLDLSRLNAGALPLRIELNAVDDLLGALLQQTEPALGGRAIEVTLPADEPLVVGRFDFVQALRVLVNLVENAAKYAPPTEAIAVHVSRRGGLVAIGVADRGPGIPPAEADRIFEPFYRPPGVTPDTAGVGLGLAIARRLARAQEGELAYQPREGGGSLFVLTLPAADLDDLG